MTNNIDRAAGIINSFCCGYCEHFGREQARALADAGLLAPELPEPTWEHTDTWVVDDLGIETIGDFVHLEWSDEMDDMRGTTTRSLNLDRRMILAILAAADRAEGVGCADA